MRLDRLYLRAFRNYAEVEARFVPGVNLLIGDNANGKTNLLEAVSYLSTARAFRAKKEQELILFGQDFAEIAATVQSQEREQTLRLQRLYNVLGIALGDKTEHNAVFEYYYLDYSQQYTLLSSVHPTSVPLGQRLSQSFHQTFF